MKPIAAFLGIALSLAAYPLSSVRRVARNEYVGTFSNTNPKLKADFPAGTKTRVFVGTRGCAHVPGRDVSAIISVQGTAAGDSLIYFSDGGTCTITGVTTVTSR